MLALSAAQPNTLQPNQLELLNMVFQAYPIHCFHSIGSANIHRHFRQTYWIYDNYCCSPDPRENRTAYKPHHGIQKKLHDTNLCNAAAYFLTIGFYFEERGSEIIHIHFNEY